MFRMLASPRGVATLATVAALALVAPDLAAQALTGASTPGTTTEPTVDDPRVGLAPGMGNAAEQVAQGMRLVAWRPKPPEFDSARGLAYVNSDLAFRDRYVYQGNFSGFMIWDVGDPTNPQLLSTVECATDQGDPSIYGNLLFISAESNRARKDCGMQGVQDGADRMRGVRIFDVSDPRNPRLVKNVQTCRGSHTHTLYPDQNDPDVMWIYVGGSSGVRSADELPGCSSGSVEENPETAQFRVDIIRVPLSNPAAAEVHTYARIFEGLQPVGNRPSGPSGCHDLTSYPEYHLVAGACGSYGILLDTRDPANPVRLDAISDVNWSLWHTAVFSNDASSVVFTDEWGGGTRARCREGDPFELGGNTILGIDAQGRFTRHAYFKLPAVQTETENCVSHNGGLIPVPGREIKVQGWYQGGVNVFDFTDPDNPFEIAFFDRGPLDAETLIPGGSWGAYWFNGYIYSSELSRGLDVLELVPSEHLSENEIAAAKLVVMEEYNPQAQPRLTWPPAFPVVRAYLDQLVRGEGLSSARTTAIAQALQTAESESGAARRDRLDRLAGELEAEAAASRDEARVRAMAAAVRDLAGAGE
jgi:hypothetical protein